jgi:predicted amidohydrolase
MLIRLLKVTIAMAIILNLSEAVSADDEVSTVAAVVDFNPQLGDLQGNISRIQKLVAQALAKGAKIVVVPEQSTTGFGITKKEALDGLAISYPFPELEGIRTLAKAHGAFIVVGIAERAASSETLYNTAAVFLPSGAIAFQRKRLASSASFGWNARGDTPFDVYSTPWGDISVLICADSFLMDWMRIVTLKGADIVVLPSNWWGQNRQVDLWRTRARQNGVWILAANRWGAEPNSYPPPSSYYMSDGPSAVVTPSGTVLQEFEADELSPLGDTILYQTIVLPRSRIGTQNLTFSVANRRPTAYTALRNTYYMPPDNKPVPGLPPPGLQPLFVLAYQPSDDPTANLKTVSSQMQQARLPAGTLIVLPGLGISPRPLALRANPSWFTADFWPQVSALLQKLNSEGLITSVLVQDKKSGQLSLDALYIPAKGAPTLFPQVHDSGQLKGSGQAPQLLALEHAEIAVMTGIDSLFPEMGTEVAKSGADIAIVVSALGGRGTAAIDAAGISDYLPRAWTIDNLAQNWQDIANGCMHVVAADASGYAFSANQAAYCSQGQTTLTYWSPQTLSLDTTSQRQKNLNWYYDFDLQTLLSSSIQ